MLFWILPSGAAVDNVPAKDSNSELDFGGFLVQQFSLAAQKRAKTVMLGCAVSKVRGSSLSADTFFAQR